MQDNLLLLVLPMLLGSLPIAGAFLWVFWERWVAPNLIPEAEIHRLATDLTATDPDNPEFLAALNEDRAHRYANPAEAVKWRRVRKVLERGEGF